MSFASKGYVINQIRAAEDELKALITSGAQYKGSWNASTNTPTITQGSGTNAEYYLVSVAGTWSMMDFKVGDTIIFNGLNSKWERIATGKEEKDDEPMIVGFVDETTTSFPTARASGKPLVTGDYVKVKSGAVTPFTIEGITFDSINDEAMWNGTAWQEQSYSSGKTNEIGVNDPFDESLSGNADYQSEINIENKTQLNKIKESVYANSTNNTSVNNAVFNFDSADGVNQVQSKYYTGVYLIMDDQTYYGHAETVEYYASQTYQITQTFYRREVQNLPNSTLDVYQRKGYITDCMFNQLYNKRGQIIWQNWKKVNETSGLAVSDPATESSTGTAVTQQDLNREILGLINNLNAEYKKAGFTFTASTTTSDGIDTTKIIIKDKNNNVLLDYDVMGAMSGKKILDAIKDLPAELQNKTIDCGSFNPQP